MPLTFYYGSGSPFAWRVWLALEHRKVPYDLKVISFSAGDLKKPEYTALNPRQKVPTIVDDRFALYESAAIVEYIDERYEDSGGPLFPGDIQQRALVRRLIAENDNYLVQANERLVDLILFTKKESWDAEAIAKARDAMTAELERFEPVIKADWFAGPLSAADHAIYPIIALALRMEKRNPDLAISGRLGPRIRSWMKRFESLPYFAKTYPPHWK
jgi:glutathione S-transferase